MNDLFNFYVPPEELSCLVGNLFAELEPPCDQNLDPDGLVLYGTTKAGRDAMLIVCPDRCTFIGNVEDYTSARNGHCPGKRCRRG